MKLINRFALSGLVCVAASSLAQASSAFPRGGWAQASVDASKSQNSQVASGKKGEQNPAKEKARVLVAPTGNPTMRRDVAEMLPLTTDRWSEAMTELAPRTSWTQASAEQFPKGGWGKESSAIAWFRVLNWDLAESSQTDSSWAQAEMSAPRGCWEQAYSGSPRPTWSPTVEERNHRRAPEVA